MKKIILIGCDGVLGKYYKNKLKKITKKLIVADIKIKRDIINKNFFQN